MKTTVALPLVTRPELLDLPQGWFNHGAEVLTILDATRPRTCVELGSWRGASAIAIARTIRPWGGILTCVDAWTGVLESADPMIVSPPAMLGECAWNVLRAGVAPWVRFLVARTQDAAAAWTDPIDFLYLDADHHYAATLADLEAWGRHVRVGGWLAGDDYGNPTTPEVQAAWDTFEARHGQRFQRIATPDTDWPGMRLIAGPMIQTASLALPPPRGFDR